jgi:hypothetical protein
VDLRDLVGALVSRDALRARQWVADSARAGFDWVGVAEPSGLDPLGLAVAAAVVEMMAGRHGKSPAPWTSGVPAAPSPMYLVRAAESLPRLRRLCEEEGPEPLRRRGLLAPPDFLTAA